MDNLELAENAHVHMNVSIGLALRARMDQLCLDPGRDLCLMTYLYPISDAFFAI